MTSDLEVRHKASSRAHSQGLLWLSVSALAYSTSVVLIKGAVAAGLNAETAQALRFSAAALVWWAILLLRRQELWPGARKAVTLMALGGLIYAPTDLSFYLGTSRVTGSLASMTFAAVPVTVALFAWLLLRERLRRLSWLCLLLAVVGATLLAGARSGRADPVGLLWLGASIVLCSLYFVLSAALNVGISPLVATTYVLSGGALFCWLWGALSHHISYGFAPMGWAAILGMALLPTVVGMSTFMVGVRTVGPTRSAIISVLEPVGGVLLSVVILGDRPALLQIVGGVFVIGAAVLLQYERARPPSPQAGRQPSGLRLNP